MFRQHLSKTFQEAEVLPTLHLSASLLLINALSTVVSLPHDCAHIAYRWVRDAKAAASLSVVPVKKVTRDYTGKQACMSTFCGIHHDADSCAVCFICQ